MGCVLGCLACNVASCCVGATCSMCGKAVPCKKSTATRGLYVFQFIVISFIAYLFSNFAHNWLKNVPVLKETCNNDFANCYGALATYRITFALSAVHAVLAVLLIGVKNSSDFRAGIQDGFWPLKFLIVVGLAVVSFFIPNWFFVAYGWVMVFGSAIFILIQLVLLVECAYRWNESWVHNMEDEEDGLEGGKKWYYLLLGTTLFMIFASIALIGVMYHFFGRSGCNENTAFITINLLACLVLCGLSVHPAVREGRPSSGLLQSSVVMLFSTYLVYSAIMSEPDTKCNPFNWDKGTKLVTVLIGAAFTIVSVVYSTIRTASASGDLMGSSDVEKSPLMGSDAAPATDEEGNKKLEDDEEDQTTYNHTHFHISFALGSMYVGMLLTNWMTLTGDNNNSVNVDHSFASFWVKMVSSWITIVLYTWTLIAPILFPNREWN